jgi:ligand-binding sensor domain-containing protein
MKPDLLLRSSVLRGGWFMSVMMSITMKSDNKKSDNKKSDNKAFLTVIAIAVALAGCSSSSTPAPVVQGTLTLTFNTPVGVNPKALVVGAGVNTDVSSNQSLTLPAGSYQITVRDATVVVPSSIVGKVFVGTASQNTVTVEAGKTSTVTVNYLERLGSGRLWLAEQDGVKSRLFSFAPDQILPASSDLSTPTPANTVRGSEVGSPSSLALDPKGNIWVASMSNKTVMAFSPSQLEGGGNPAPIAKLTFPEQPWALTFDSSGNLWVGTERDNFFRYAPDQQKTAGQSNLTFQRNYAFGLPRKMLFDAAGNLWMTTVNFDDKVIMYRKSRLEQLASSTDFTPDVTLSDLNATSMTFDSAGNMWLGTSKPNDAPPHGSVIKLTSSQFVASGSPAPALKITGFNGSSALKSDALGGLWVLVNSDNHLLHFTASQLNSSGSPTPSGTLLVGANFNQSDMLFNPVP